MGTLLDTVSEAVLSPVADLRVDCPAAQAVGLALDEARASGTRAAVCVADLSSLSLAARSRSPLGAALEDGALHFRRWLRPNDRLVRVNDLIVVVTWGLTHPRDAEVVAERMRRAISASGGHGVGVGLALYPTHGDGADLLLERARASAERDQVQGHTLWEEASA